MANYICIYCGYEGGLKRVLRGSALVEKLIYGILLIPGPIYSIWRRTGTSPECPNCGKMGMVKRHSGEGEIAALKFENELKVPPPPPPKEALAVPENIATPVAITQKHVNPNDVASIRELSVRPMEVIAQKSTEKVAVPTPSLNNKTAPDPDEW